MVKKAGAETLAGEVAERLRAAILAGRFHAGEWLRPADLRVEYGVSATVVRDALARLAEQHLAVLSPNRGYHVVQFGEQDVRELVEFRIVAETAALDLSIARGDMEWEGAVVAAHHRLRAAGVEPGYGSDEWFLAHNAFHLALLTACGNSLLLEACRDGLSAGDLYLRWSRRESGLEAGTLAPSRDPDAEHAAILDAVLGRDAELAVHRYREHLERTADLMADARRPVSA
ncbi:MAG TPA: GntR family transcriptional regulator [Microbacteriaceae bacterium]|nr:GntR family transcriptional regulator [Microbacteriaceae bacterium]